MRLLCRCCSGDSDAVIARHDGVWRMHPANAANAIAMASATLDALDATPPSELIRHLLLAVAEGAVACLRTSPLFGLLSDESKREASALVRTARQLHANHCKPRGARTHLLLTGF